MDIDEPTVLRGVQSDFSHLLMSGIKETSDNKALANPEGFYETALHGKDRKSFTHQSVEVQEDVYDSIPLNTDKSVDVRSTSDFGN